MFWYRNTHGGWRNAFAQQVTKRLFIFLAVFVLIAFAMSSRAQPQNGPGTGNFFSAERSGRSRGPASSWSTACWPYARRTRLLYSGRTTGI